MKKMIMILLAGFATVCQACWYQKSNYTDYIHSVNDQNTIQISESNGAATYYIQNNNVVDFPITVSMKLISNDQVVLNPSGSQLVPEILKGKLQYRVLPGGNWITVAEYNTPTGTIPKESVPTTYFGQNNIWPQGCKAGDIIMIRLYVTDGMWQSGELNSQCDLKLTTVSTPYGNRTSLPNSFSYIMNGIDMAQHDLGGAWFPHLVVTVVYSGKERPLK